MPESLHEAYERDGYCVVRGLVAHGDIDRLIDVYRATVLESRKPFFRQSTNRWTHTKRNAYGHATDSFRDPHDYPDYPSFCAAIRDVLCASAVQQALEAITRSEAHRVVQSMLFDQNTNTPPHQDWYYLDSMPNGHLLAGWFALEDIHEDAGRFYVVPGSHKLPLDPDNSLDINAYMKKVEDWFAANASKVHAPALNKGDALFWSSRTIHGSLPTQDERRSRMSATAHYLPSQYQFGSRNAPRPIHVDYEEHNGMKVRRALPIHRHYSLMAKAQTEVFAFMYDRPALRRVALTVASLLKR
jgi:phytanoyl-CoA hydroxylase